MHRHSQPSDGGSITTPDGRIPPWDIGRRCPPRLQHKGWRIVGSLANDSAAFCSILRDVLKSRDWLVERNGFEPAVPFLNFLTTTLGNGFHNGRLSFGCCRIGTESSNPLRSASQSLDFRTLLTIVRKARVHPPFWIASGPGERLFQRSKDIRVPCVRGEISEGRPRALSRTRTLQTDRQPNWARMTLMIDLPA